MIPLQKELAKQELHQHNNKQEIQRKTRVTALTATVINIAALLTGKTTPLDSQRQSANAASSYIISSSKVVSSHVTAGDKPTQMRLKHETPSELLSQIREVEPGNKYCADCDTDQKAEWFQSTISVNHIIFPTLSKLDHHQYLTMPSIKSKMQKKALCLNLWPKITSATTDPRATSNRRSRTRLLSSFASGSQEPKEEPQDQRRKNLRKRRHRRRRRTRHYAEHQETHHQKVR